MLCLLARENLVVMIVVAQRKICQFRTPEMSVVLYGFTNRSECRNVKMTYQTICLKSTLSVKGFDLTTPSQNLCKYRTISAVLCTCNGHVLSGGSGHKNARQWKLAAACLKVKK